MKALYRSSEVGAGPPQRRSPAVTLAVPAGLAQHGETGPLLDGREGGGGTAPPSSEPRLSRGTGRTQELGWRPGGGGGEAEHKGAPWRSVVKAETGGLAVCVGTFTGHTKS